jgi:hypothetical protein
MKPSKKGQIVRFHTPLPDEDADVLYSVVDIFTDVERPRAQIRAVNIPGSFMPINTVLVEELEVIEVNTSDLVGHEVTIDKADKSQAKGKVVKVSEQKIMLDLTAGVKGVETNVWLTIQKDNGTEYIGTLFVN